MSEIIKIKCPFDGVVISVENQPGIENKSVTCPICKHKYRFTEFKRVGPAPSNNDDSDTEYPNMRSHGSSSYNYEEERTLTELPQRNFTLGRLKVVGTAVSFQLQSGLNIVGRKSIKSQADFQIDTAEKRTLSREHIRIEVKKVPVKGFVHYVSLCKEKVNKTYIGNMPLEYGDVFILNHGDILKLPDVTLKFEIPDDEETDVTLR